MRARGVKRRQPTLGETTARALRRRSLAAGALIEDLESGEPLEVAVRSALHTHFESYRTRTTKTSHGKGFSWEESGAEFVNYFLENVEAEMLPPREFQGYLFHIMVNHPAHSSPNLALKAAIVYAEFLKAFPPCRFSEEEKVLCSRANDEREELYWNPMTPTGDLFHGDKKRSGEIEEVSGFRLVFFWSKKIVELLKTGDSGNDLGYVVAFKSLVDLLERDLNPRLEVVKAQRKETQPGEMALLVRQSILWRLMEENPWTSHKGEFIKYLTLGVAAEFGNLNDHKSRKSCQGKSDLERVALPQEIAGYMKRFMVMLLDMFGTCEEEGWFLANDSGLRCLHAENHRDQMDKAIIATTFQRLSPVEFKHNFKNKAAVLASLPEKDVLRLIAVIMSMASHVKGNATPYLEEVHQTRLNPCHMCGPFKLDPLDLATFFNNDSIFRWAYSVDTLGPDGMTLCATAAARGVLLLPEFKSSLGKIREALLALLERLKGSRKFSGEAMVKLKHTLALLKLASCG